jgi:hypothetical protein
LRWVESAFGILGGLTHRFVVGVCVTEVFDHNVIDGSLIKCMGAWLYFVDSVHYCQECSWVVSSFENYCIGFISVEGSNICQG